MYTEHFSINHSSNWQVVEHLSAVLPRIGVAIFSVDLIIEPIDCSDLSGLMIASEKSDPVGVFNLQTEQVLKGFH